MFERFRRHKGPSLEDQVQADIADFQFRDPIVDYPEPPTTGPKGKPLSNDERWRAAERQRLEREAQNAEIDKQWSTVTAIAQRAIQDDPELRHTAAGFVAEPLSETLPAQALDTLAQNPRIGRAARAAGHSLGATLHLAPVPDDLLAPDITNAPVHTGRHDVARSLLNTKQYMSEAFYPESLARERQTVEQSPGVTKAEKALVARRYRYARDVKLLGLSAELADNPLGPDVQPHDGVVAHELPSGARIVMTEEAFATDPDLLDPSSWQGRKQLKDRVHMVTVGDKEYVLKERKTPRHTDVKKYGHVDGLTSAEEFEAARDFAELGTIEDGEVRLRWERPIGYAEFPDGFQFCLFEKEDDLTVDGPKGELADEILSHREQYEGEYADVKQKARAIYHNRDDLVHTYADTIRGHDTGSGVPLDELTFDEFAAVKSLDMIDTARYMLSDTIAAQGYINSDLDGYGFKIEHGGDPAGKPVLDIIGFDFEYYQADPAAAAKIISHNQSLRSSDRPHVSMRISGEREIMTAAEFAMKGVSADKPPELH